MNLKVKTPFTSSFANAFSSVQAWRTTTLVLAALLVFSMLQIVRMANHQNALLIPQGLMNSNKVVRLNLGDPFSPEYVSKVAEGDAHFLLDWTPDNVEQQYQVFASRLTTDLYAKKAPGLLEEAKENKANGYTQSFFRTRTYLKGSSVTLAGILVRTIGGKEVFRGPAAYIINYTSNGEGLLQVSGVSQPAPDKTAAAARSAS